MKSGVLNIVLLIVISAGLVLGGIGTYLITRTPAFSTSSLSSSSPPSSSSSLSPSSLSSTPPTLATSSSPPPRAAASSSATSSRQTAAPPSLPVSVAVGTTSAVSVIPTPTQAPSTTLPTSTPPSGQIGGPLPSATATTTAARATSTRTVAAPPQKAIDPRAIVGIVCNITQTYTVSDPQYEPATEEGYSRGTGVIIDTRGYILTNKHVGGTFVQKATTTIGYDELVLTITSKNTGCLAGGLSEDTVLPTSGQIQAFNPTARVPVLGYTVAPLYEPTGAGWSELERSEADFTVLKITGLSPDGPTFGVASLPKEFPHAELLPLKDSFRAGAPVLSYGAPADATAAKADLFSTIYILGATGQLAKLEKGNRAFADVPLTVRLNMEVSGGRSGSPVFWNGYVVGIVQAHKSGDKTQTLAVASDAILKYLRETHQWEPAK